MKPDSSIVGTSGSTLIRFADVTASARSLPPLISCNAACGVGSMNSVRPVRDVIFDMVEEWVETTQRLDSLIETE